MDNKIVILTISIILFYLIYKNNCNYKSIEKMTDSVDQDIDTKIRNQINMIYKADVESIRTLANISKKLQDGTLTVAGDLTVDGKFNYLPKGSIIAFNGPIAPKGWALCDGKNGTPDLRGRFIRMSSDTLGSFNSWGGKVVSDNKVAYDKSISANSRTDKNSFILKHRFGDKAGTDHQILTTDELPSHTHDMDYGGVHHHTYSKGTNSGCGARGSSYRKSGCPYYHDTTLNTHDDGNHKHTIKTTGSGWGHNNQPPYYVLSYIMKL